MKFLIVGLGNIGVEYENTRHNIGFMVVDELAKKLETKFEIGRHAFYAEGKYKGKSLHLIKPTTYMNLSGKAVQHWSSFLKISTENILVIVDDLAIPFGKLRLRAKGSSAGHNGLKNIEEIMQTQNYPRLRFGIGDNFPKGRQVDYVLSPFSKEEMTTLPISVEKACQMVFAFSTIGIERTMSQMND
ncbi:MAG: aminoacyl-tRNA hydrolase [Flammeovirgaceae bacterium]